MLLAMQRLYNALSHYQAEIGNYDKPYWMLTVEQRILHGLEIRPKKEDPPTIHNQLLDLDILRGSMFTKSQPVHNLRMILWDGIAHTLFAPFYFRYWCDHMSARFARLFMVHYMLCVVHMVLHVSHWRSHQFWSEHSTPLICTLLLGIIHAHIVSPVEQKRKCNNVSGFTCNKETQSANGNIKEHSVRNEPLSSHLNNSNVDFPPSTGNESSNIRLTHTEPSCTEGNSNDVVRIPDENIAAKANEATSCTSDEQALLLAFISAKDRQIPEPVQFLTGKSEDAEPETHKVEPDGDMKEHEVAATVAVKKLQTDQSNVPSSHHPPSFVRSFSERPSKKSDSSRGGAADKTDAAAVRSPHRGVGGRRRLYSGSCTAGGGVLAPLAGHSEAPDPTHVVTAAMSVTNPDPVATEKHNSKVIVVDSGGAKSSSVSENTSAATAAIRRNSKRTIRVSTVELPTAQTPPTSTSPNTAATSTGEPNQQPACFKNMQNIEEIFLKALPGLKEASNEDTFTFHTRRKEQFEKLFRERSAAHQRCSVPGESILDHRHGETVDTDLEESSDRPQRCTTSHMQEVPLPGSVQPEEGQLNLQQEQTSSPVEDSRRVNGVRFRDTHPERTYSSAADLKNQIASETEYERMNSDLCTEVSTTSAGEEEVTAVGPGSAAGPTQDNVTTPASLLNMEDPVDPFVLWFQEESHQPPAANHTMPHQGGEDVSKPGIALKETVTCLYWESGVLRKSELTLLDIAWSIIQSVRTQEEHSSTYLKVAVWGSLLLACLPAFYQYSRGHLLQDTWRTGTHCLYQWQCIRPWLILTLDVVLRLFAFLMFGLLLTVNEKIYQKRVQYAKHFCHLTSSRRARKWQLPHFRLNKVRNIRCWLSLRSFMKRRGPQRSVENVTTYAFYVFFSLMSLLCVRLVQREGPPISKCLMYWEWLALCLFLSVFLVRFITLSMKISKKYRNPSVLMTEQVNLYLTMAKKPHKKLEFDLAYRMLEVAGRLLKEVDGPFRVCGYRIHPLVYNVLKVIILSACSAVLTDYCHFTVKLYKIKINPANW